jgi:hypothetical protein
LAPSGWTVQGRNCATLAMPIHGFFMKPEVNLTLTSYVPVILELGG